MLHSYYMLVCVHLPLQWDFLFTCLHQTKGSALSRILPWVKVKVHMFPTIVFISRFLQEAVRLWQGPGAKVEGGFYEQCVPGYVLKTLKGTYKKLMLLQGAMYLSNVFCWHRTPKDTLNSTEGCNSEVVFQNDCADSNTTYEFQQLTRYVNCSPVIHSRPSVWLIALPLVFD